MGCHLTSHQKKTCYYNNLSHTNTCVSLGNITCVKLIRNYIFHILTCEDIDDVISRFYTVESCKRVLSMK